MKFKGVLFSPDGKRKLEFSKVVLKDEIGDLGEFAANFILSKGGKNLISVSPVEIFEDEKNIGENKKSITYEMVFQDREKTLEDKDVNPIIDEIIDIVKKNFNAKLRV